MVVRKGLGKNMDSVFSMKNVADVIDNPKVPEPKSSLPLSSLKQGKFQPRNDVENSGLSELAQSIKQNGILNPIVVRKLSSDKYEILAGEIEMGHARALLSLPEEQQVWLAQQIKDKGLSVRQTEEYVSRYKERENTSENPHKTAQKSSEFIKFENELSKILNTDVKLVSNSKGRGNLQISFKNEKEFAAILDLLRSISNK